MGWYLPFPQTVHWSLFSKIVPLEQSPQLELPGALDCPFGQGWQIMSSFVAPENRPAEQRLHALSARNGFSDGFDMKEPLGQHPYRALLYWVHSL